MTAQLRDKIADEAKRIEEDAVHSFKGHFNASSGWEALHLWLGVPAAIFSTVAGATIFADAATWWNVIAGTLGVLAGAIMAVATFIDPNRKAEVHHKAGADYQQIRNDARLILEVKIHSGCSDDFLIQQVELLRKRQTDCAKDYPVIPTWAYRKAKAGVASGEADYRN